MSAATFAPVDRRAALAARAGAVVCLLFVVLVALPYLFADATAVGTYYGVTPVGPPVVALFAAVALVAFLAGAAGRSDPQTVAGTVVVLGVVMTALSLWWALLARPVVGGLAGLPSVFAYHPLALFVVALAALVCAGWFARVVLSRGAG